MLIRPATPADLPAILAIYNEAVLNTTATADYEPGTLEARMAWYEERVQNGYPVFVAEDAQVVGWSALSPYRPRIGYRFSAEVSIYIAADRRGQGIGKLLLPPLIETARQRGFHALLAGIDADNEASLRLHVSFGFEKVAHFRKVYTKFGRWLDVIYLELLLNMSAPEHERSAG